MWEGMAFLFGDQQCKELYPPVRAKLRKLQESSNPKSQEQIGAFILMNLSKEKRIIAMTHT
jgi:hypothetical protein